MMTAKFMQVWNVIWYLFDFVPKFYLSFEKRKENLRQQGSNLAYLRGRVCFVDRLTIKAESNLPHRKALLKWRTMQIYNNEDSSYLGVHFKSAMSNANYQTVKYKKKKENKNINFW